MKILLVHGVGYQEDKNFEAEWQPIIQQRLPSSNLQFSALTYDHWFKERSINWLTLSSVALELLKSWTEHGGEQRPGEPTERGLFTPVEATVGMSIKWAEFYDLRKTLRDALKQQMVNDQPDVIVAHSLGTLICYDLFARPENAGLIQGRTWLTIGCQVAHPALRNVFDGYLSVPPVKRWYAQYNRNDLVFAWEPVDLHAENFVRIDSPFREALINHDALCYLKVAESAQAWAEIASGKVAPTVAVRDLAGSFRLSLTHPHAGRKSVAGTKARPPDRRALIVGINRYAQPQLKLEGCVNDAYTMSELLQEEGFNADEIRMVIDERATTEAIQQRIQWLLADTGPDDVRILYYSGHGVQVPAYGVTDKPDHLIEALVPYDFDWTEAHMITDKWLSRQYGNLSYQSHFVALFDCCHAGGLSRGGALSVRSVLPPDDVAHRQLKWDQEWKMWVPRDFVSPDVKRLDSTDPRSPILRLGRGLSLRPKRTRRLGKAFGHLGPYMPTIMMACRADELAHEYRHGGGHSYGAFTYALSQVLRDPRRAPIGAAQDLCNLINNRLPALGYNQHCAVDGPSEQLSVVNSWLRPPTSPTKELKKTRRRRSKR
jgi:metacaspase-1